MDTSPSRAPLVFKTNGRQRYRHHQTHYDYPVPSLLPEGSKVVLEPPSRSKERIDPRVRSFTVAARTGISMYTYSEVDGNHTVEPSTIHSFPEPLWQSMTRVSRQVGITKLEMVCYSTGDTQTDDNTFVLLERRTALRAGHEAEVAQYRFSLREWTSLDQEIRELQWYKELECLRLRKTERSYWHVLWRIEGFNLTDADYTWFDIDAFGDDGPNPIVWWRNPKRKLVVNEKMTPVAIKDLGTDEADRRCPICLKPYDGCDTLPSSTNQSEMGEKAEWLLREGPSQCPLCRDSAGIPVPKSPYTGGWSRRLPLLHHAEYLSNRILGGDPNELSDHTMVVVETDIEGLTREIFGKPAWSIAPGWSDNGYEEYQFLVTDPEPQYHYARDDETTKVAKDALVDIVSRLALKKPRILQRELFELYCDSVDEYMRSSIKPKSLPLMPGMTAAENMRCYLEPATIEWVTNMCSRATMLAIRQYNVWHAPGGYIPLPPLLGDVLDMDDADDDIEADDNAIVFVGLYDDGTDGDDTDGDGNGGDDEDMDDDDDSEAQHTTAGTGVEHAQGARTAVGAPSAVARGPARELNMVAAPTTPKSSLRLAQRDAWEFLANFADLGTTFFGFYEERWPQFTRRLFVARFGEQVLDMVGDVDYQALARELQLAKSAAWPPGVVDKSDYIARLAEYEVAYPGRIVLGRQGLTIKW